jgi:hypothetical protein
MKALVFNGKIVDLSDTVFEVHESMTWYDCEDIVEHGFLYQDGAFVDPSTLVSAEEKMALLRHARNILLSDTDWWASSDLTMTAAQTAYRQALRNVTATATSLDDVVWPTKPEVTE